MADDLFEIEEAVEKPLTPKQITLLHDLGHKQLKMEEEIVKLEEKIKKKKDDLHQMNSQEVPRAMLACRQKEFPLGNGKAITIKDITKAALPTKGALETAQKKDEDKYAELLHNQTVGMEWLRKNKLESIIKNVVSIEFSKGQDNIVGDFIGMCEEHEVPYSRAQIVHPSTLSNAVAEKMAKGVEVPMKELGVYCGQQSIIK